MNLANDISALYLLGIICFALWFFYVHFYQGYRVDKARHELFVIRDEMFDFAAAGGISFTHPAYMMLRETMNGMIRLMHRLSWVSVLMIVLLKKPRGVEEMDFFKSFKKAQSGLDDATKKMLAEYFIRMNVVMGIHIIKSSIVLYSIALVVRVLYSLYSGVKGFTHLVQSLVVKFPGEVGAIDTKAFYDRSSGDKRFADAA